VSQWHRHTLALDERGYAVCFISYSTGERSASPIHYDPCVGLRSREARSSSRFIRLNGGHLHWSTFLADEEWYEVLVDKHVSFPSGANAYFGVVSNDDWHEDQILTRQVFGATSVEYQALADALGAVAGRKGWRYPSVTFSKSRENSCDLTEALIPRGFPYVAFEQSQYAWSHVSLGGIGAVLAFVFSRRDSLLRRQLLTQEGVTEELIDRLVSLGHDSSRAVRWSEM
jgi:hypothetical protein